MNQNKHSRVPLYNQSEKCQYLYECQICNRIAAIIFYHNPHYTISEIATTHCIGCINQSYVLYAILVK